MRLYNIFPEEVKFSWGKMLCILLGEQGRGRKLVVVPFHAEYDEKAKDYAIGTTRRGHPKVIRTGKETEGWIARVNTYYTYTRGTTGRTKVIKGNIKQIAFGWGAFGDAGRLGSWGEYLFTVEPPFPGIIKVIPSGGLAKVQPYYIVFWKDRVHEVKEHEWEVYIDQHKIQLQEKSKEELEKEKHDAEVKQLRALISKVSFRAPPEWRDELLKAQLVIEAYALSYKENHRLSPKEAMEKLLRR